MNALGTLARVAVALAAGLATSFLVAQWWSPVCHEGCPGAIVAGMWVLLLALPVALAVVAARGRALARLGVTLLVFGVLGGAVTLVAAWFQGHPHGG